MITANVALTAKTPTEAVMNSTVIIAGSVSLRGQCAGNSRLISVWYKLGHGLNQLRTSARQRRRRQIVRISQ
jgi:hypothetical protein